MFSAQHPKSMPETSQLVVRLGGIGMRQQIHGKYAKVVGYLWNNLHRKTMTYEVCFNNLPHHRDAADFPSTGGGWFKA